MKNKADQRINFNKLFCTGREKKLSWKTKALEIIFADSRLKKYLKVFSTKNQLERQSKKRKLEAILQSACWRYFPHTCASNIGN